MTDIQTLTHALPRLLQEQNADQAFAQVIAPSECRDQWLPEALTLFNVRTLSPGQLSAMANAVFGCGINPRMAPRLANVLGRIGRYGFSFPMWRYLSQKTDYTGSLMECFGMTRLRRDTDTRDATLPDPQRDEFGPGFVCREQGLYVEYRRAYLICSNNLATTIIRNNSYFFGRDRLPHAAYVSFGKVSHDQLENLKPGDFNAEGPFKCLQDIKLNALNLDHLQTTLNTLDHFDARLSRWLYNTGKEYLIGFMRNKCEAGAANMPHMALIDAQLPPWFPESAVPISKKAIEDFREQGPSGVFGKVPDSSSKFVILTGAAGDYPIRPLHQSLSI